MGKNRKKIAILSTAAIGTLITTALSSTVYAKTDAILTQDVNGNINKYLYKDLQNAVEADAVGLKSDLFDKYLKEKIISVHDDINGYIKYKAIEEANETAIVMGDTFKLDDFTEKATGEAKVGEPKDINKITVDENGKLVVTPEKQSKELKVESVSAINETTVQVTGLAKEVKEDTLKDKKITLKAGDVSLTATYVATSLTEDGKANFVLDDSKKLTDAVTYTVSADWASFTKADFVAKVAAPYIKTVSVTTANVPAVTYVANPVSGVTKVYFTAKNQYGEDIALTAENVAGLKVKATLNGVPMLTSEVVKDNAVDGYVEVKKTLAEGNKITLALTNTINDKDVEVGTVSYTVAKEAAAVATTVSDMKAVYANAENRHTQNAEAKEVLPEDHVTLSSTVKDQFGNPMNAAEVRWVVEEGKDVITKTTKNAGNFEAIAEVSDAANFTFRAAKAGNVKISAYIGNGEKVTYEVTVGAKKVETIGTVTFADAKNHEEATSIELAPNSGAVLKASDVKFEITSLPKGATKEDITLVAVQGDKEATKDKVYVKATTKVAGEYKFRAYVGTAVDAEGAIASAESTITTTVNQAVNSIEVEPFAENELTAGKEVTKKVTFKNKWNEEVTVLGNALNVAPTGNMTVTKLQEDKATVAEAQAVKYLKFVGTADAADTVTLVAGSKSVSIELTTQKAAAIKTVDLGQDITTGVIAGQINTVDAEKVYAPITVKDNYGNAVIPTADQIGAEAGKLRVTAAKISGDTTEWQVPLVAIKYYTLNKDGKIVVQDAKNADTVGIALEINANACNNTADKIATVTLSNGEAAEKEIKDTLNVSVKAVRKIAGITVAPKSATVGLNGTTLVTVKPVDQYGNFIALTDPVAAGTVTSSDEAVANFGQFLANGVNGQLPSVGADTNYVSVDKDGKCTDDASKIVGYVYAIRGTKTGEVTVTVKDVTPSSTLKDTTTIKVTPAASVVSSMKLVNDNINEDGTYKYKVEKNKAAATFGVKAYDANGVEVAVNPADVIWTSSDVNVATVVNGTVTTKDIVADADKTVTITASVGLVKQSITLTVSKDAKAMVPGTVKVTLPAKVDADATKAGIQISLDGKTEDGEIAAGQANAGTITLTFKGSNQFGAVEDITEATTPVQVISFNPEVATVGTWTADADTLMITPVGVGSTTVRVTVGTQDILVDVNVTDKNAKIIADKAAAEKAAADKAAADPVKAEIAALPVKDSVTLTNKTAVTDARGHYDALTGDQKTLVGVITKLTEAETKIGQLEAAAQDAQAKEQAKQALTTKIAEVATAEKDKVEGAVVGNQIDGSKAILDAAKAEADTVLNNAGSSTDQLTQATTTLNSAIEAYKAATVKALTGLNNIEITGTASDETNTVTLSDGETLTVTSGTEAAATVAVKDTSKVNVTGVAAGTSTITVKVTVGGHIVKVGTFTVTVK